MKDKTVLFEAEHNGYKIYGECEINKLTNKTPNYDKIKIYTEKELEARDSTFGETNG